MFSKLTDLSAGLFAFGFGALMSFQAHADITELRTSHFYPPNVEGIEFFEDLGTGIAFGSTLVTAVNGLCNVNVFPGTDPACPSFFEEIEFNPAGLTALNSATGDFAVGGKISAGQAFGSSGGSIGDFSITLILNATTVVDAIDHGWYSDVGFHNANNTDYLVGVSGGVEYRNFFIFDLSGVTEEIVSAKLRIESVSTNPSGSTYTIYDFAGTEDVAVFACEGFTQPFDSALNISKKTKKAIPAKIFLEDADANVITDTDIVAPPVITVEFAGVIFGDGVVDDFVLEPVGDSNDGNAFSYNPDTEQWEYRISTKQFSEPGTYTVEVRSGDETEYTISATGGNCTNTFTRLN